ncbi:MAG: type II toxin-antitoxin system PemK/MazF family toxin [bacterium]|nr:type II toxin-antitoxin system PemK/MazF family toxin [bacterium]
MKDFDSWNKEKKNLEQFGHDALLFRERQIWWCSIGRNIGSEQDGKNEFFDRPVLVFRKFNSKLCWILPISSKIKSGIYYYNLEYEGKIFSVLLSQLRLISVKRFRRFEGIISRSQFSMIQDRIIAFIK